MATNEKAVAQATDASAASTPDGLTRRDFVAAVGKGAVAAAALASTKASAAAVAYEYRIHPAIGVARMGNADPDDGFILGPELPGQGPTDGLSGSDVAAFKVNGNMKPQAARFRVWRYCRDASGRVWPDKQMKVGQDGVAGIWWRVHLANRKAANYVENGPEGETIPASDLRNPTIDAGLPVWQRTDLINDFGPRSIGGANAAPVKFTAATASGPSAHVVTRADGSVVIDYLGQLRTDGDGNLLVFGGKGRSASSIDPPQTLTHWSNNDFWFDDASDGPVTATISFSDGTPASEMSAAGKAWVLVAPPRIAPAIRSAISLYDVLYDMGVRWAGALPNNALYDTDLQLSRLKTLNGLWPSWLANPDPATNFEFGSYRPDYQTEIWPIVVSALDYVYTTGLVNFKHLNMLTDPLGVQSADGDKARGVFFSYIRPPQLAATNGNGPATMPRLYGDAWYVGNNNFHYDFGQNGTGNSGGGGQTDVGGKVPQYQRYMTLTATQYGLMHAWSAGKFQPSPGVLEPDSQVTPHGLDRAALENCIGGPFFPGIECSWQMRNPALFIEPFRIDHAAVTQVLDLNGNPEHQPLRPGNFSRQMALPWQCDFNDCSKLLNLGWWPSARPDDVFLNPGDPLKARVPWARFDDGSWFVAGTTDAYNAMHDNWYKFGFVLDDGSGGYTEQQRNPSIPPPPKK